MTLLTFLFCRSASTDNSAADVCAPPPPIPTPFGVMVSPATTASVLRYIWRSPA